MKLVRLFALGLELDEEKFIHDFFKFPITGMRPLHYPPAPPEDKENDVQNIGLGAHSDFSCTPQSQNVEGFQADLSQI